YDQVSILGETKCAKQLLPCQMKILNFWKDQFFDRVSGEKHFRASFYLASLVFPTFEETAVLNFETFVAQFGGCLGLYLGLSMASLVHLPVFCMRQLAFTVK